MITEVLYLCHHLSFFLLGGGTNGDIYFLLELFMVIVTRFCFVFCP